MASTRAAAGIYEDRSGPILVDFLREQGFDTPAARVVPDANMAAAVDAGFAEAPHVLLTSGGTGISPDDNTVECVAPYLDKQLPGIAHAFYTASASVPTAAISRAIAGFNARTFAMALPGSTGAAKDATRVLAPLLNHIVNQLEGHHEH